MKLMKRIVQWDENSSKKNRMKFSSPVQFRVAALLSHSGDSWLWCGVLFLFWLFAEGSIQNNLAYWGISIAVTALFIFILKRVIHRKRPEGDWGSIYRKSDPHSFPSGHAVRAGLIVVLAGKTFGFTTIILFLIWAFLMMHSRVITGVHYLLDIYFGFIFGIIIGILWVVLQPWLLDTFPILFNRDLWWSFLGFSG